MSDLHRPKEIYSFLIWGGWYGSRNIGDSAILMGLKQLIQRTNPKKEHYIRALSTDVDYTTTHGVGAEQALVKRDVFRISPWPKILKVFMRADKVIISGGTPIFDFSHAVRTLYFYLPILLKKRFGFFGIGVKPIESRCGRFYIPRVLNKSEFISVRDQDSKDILEGLGVKKNITLTADSAFFAQPSPESEVHTFLESHGVDRSESVLVVAPRVLSGDQERLYLEEHMDERVITRTPLTIAESVDAVSSKFDRIVFLAMHFYGPDSGCSHYQRYC